jgi:hypothetical protein
MLWLCSGRLTLADNDLINDILVKTGNKGNQEEELLPLDHCEYVAKNFDKAMPEEFYQ